MISIQTSRETVGYTNRYAAAQYYMGGGKGYPPRNGLVENRYYAGKILEGGQFHVLRPDRTCFISEFLSFQLVSTQWDDLSEIERSLLVAVYNQKKLALDTLSPKLPTINWREIAASLEKTGYLRWAESQAVEMSLVGEAEVQHRIFNLDAGNNLMGTRGGIRIQHHSVQDHEIDLGRASSLSVNVDGMRICIITLQDGGAVIQVDHDLSHQIYVSQYDEDRKYAQAYVDHILPMSGNG